MVFSTPRGSHAGRRTRRMLDYRHFWEKLEARLSQREACKTMVGLLELASRDGIEAVLAMRLEAMLAHGELPDLAVLRENLRLDKPIA